MAETSGYVITFDTIKPGHAPQHGRMQLNAKSKDEAKQRFLSSHRDSATVKYKITSCAKQ